MRATMTIIKPGPKQEARVAATDEIKMPIAIDDAAAWQAVLERDNRRDGTFVYAVASTGVFCRPSCPSRRPRRESVTFFASAVEASRAGFRPCRRCRPGDAASPQARVVQRVRRYLDAHFDEPVTLRQLGRETGVSPYHLQRTFKAMTGVTPKQYVDALRAERLKARLAQGDSVTAATYEAGYGSASRAHKQAGAWLGMTPTAYRRGGQGMNIRFTIVPSALGRLLVGATERGVCSVMLGDADATLETELRRQYPNATIEHAGSEPDQWAEAVARCAGGADERLANVPLDARGTAFQHLVWRALREIPRGATRSYGEIATAVGKPRAVRAVGNACAANPVALLIPCHRAVRAGGAPGGYRWGVDRKSRLLDQEREAEG